MIPYEVLEQGSKNPKCLKRATRTGQVRSCKPAGAQTRIMLLKQARRLKDKYTDAACRSNEQLVGSNERLCRMA